MNKFNGNLDKVMKDELDKFSPYLSFDRVWGNYVKNKNKIFGFKKIIAIPIIAIFIVFALLTVVFASYQLSRRVDNTDYPFINDSQVIGKWQSVDFVKKIDDFNPDKLTWQGDLYLKDLAFINDGKMLAALENENLSSTTFTWTKGMILCQQERTASNYEIKDINGTAYMFFQWKSGDYIFRNMEPFYYVLKKVDGNDYSDFSIKPIYQDKIDYPFIDDPEVIGDWNSVDFVQDIDNFKPDAKSWIGDLYLINLKISENGKISGATANAAFGDTLLKWTKGLILNTRGKTASKYVVKEMDGKTFLLFEWKSGDYVYRGMKPWYYVFEKVK